MNIASYIDHTVLKQNTTATDISKLCQEAITEGFVAVCVPPYFVSTAKDLLKNSEVKIATVIGFPFGYQSLVSKLAEIEDAIVNGADELDVVHNLSALKSNDWEYLEQEIKSCTELVHKQNKIIKVIVESGLLNKEELKKCCKYYSPIGIDYMKTSTGFAPKGADIESVQLMRMHLPEHIFIKAAGGIRSYAFAKDLIEHGADRLGCSASVTIVNELKEL